EGYFFMPKFQKRDKNYCLSRLFVKNEIYKLSGGKKVLENIKTITEIAFYIMSTLTIIKTLTKDDE
ncbi:hypothetical protein, partial [Staphylococcus haemolyticus]|uniref:hypothetical protein n=1 Tax=Staphylococcus haemolyticus TaxID=1283 RepID=UPI001C5C9F76